MSNVMRLATIFIALGMAAELMPSANRRHEARA
jgi:hypothetical protein